MIKRIHINRHRLAQNKKHGLDRKPITVKTSKTNTYAHQVDILDKKGNIVARVIHAKKPLKCGARCWVTVYGEVKIHNKRQSNVR
jgi:hypothetical protein